MPQLVPFYYMHQGVLAVIGISVVYWLLTSYILPKFVEKNNSQLYISKL